MNLTIIEVMRNYARKQADRETAKKYFTAAQILSDNWTEKYKNGTNVISHLHKYVLEGYKLKGTFAVKGEMTVNLRTRHASAIFSAIETAETLNEWMTCSKCADSVLFTESHSCNTARAAIAKAEGN